MRGPERNASAPRIATSASCASVCPPRLDPPVPSTTTSVAPARSRAAALPMSSSSSVRAGRRSSGKLPSACCLRTQPSASAHRFNASSSAAFATPCAPMFSARALSIFCVKGIPHHDHVAAEKFRALRLIRLGEPLRASDHKGERLRVEQPLGDALGVRERHGIDHRVALLGIIDAELVELDLHKLAGDLARCVEGNRVGALEIGLGLVELFLRRALGGHALPLLLDQRQGFGPTIAARGGPAAQDVGMVEPKQAGADTVSKPALLAYLMVKPRAHRARPIDVVYDVGGEEIRIVA